MIYSKLFFAQILFFFKVSFLHQKRNNMQNILISFREKTQNEI